MAYALVGSAGTVATGSGSASPAFGQATSAGNLLIAWVIAVGGGATTSASGWSKAVARGDLTAIWYKPGSGAGETAPAFTGTGNMFAMLAEFSGGATSSPFDQGIAQGGAGTSPVVATNTSADVQAGELLVSAARDALSKAGTATTSSTFNNGATPTTNANNDSTSTTDHYRFDWGITTGNSAADSNSHANGSMNLSATDVVIGSFKLAPVVTLYSQPCNLGNSPGMLSQALAPESWRRRLRGILVPDLWTPAPV